MTDVTADAFVKRVPGGISPIKQALVQELRANTALKTAVGNRFHEGFAPAKEAYPLITYHVQYAPYDYLWGSLMREIGITVNCYSLNQVEAQNLDTLVLTVLHDAELNVSGQSTLICRRISDLSFADADEEGKKVYVVGGIYEIWTDQLL